MPPACQLAPGSPAPGGPTTAAADHVARTGPPGGTGTVDLVSGATTVRRTGLSGGTVLSTATDPDRYDIDATAGLSRLVLDRA